MLYIHLGMPKTGTSLLQRCLSQKALKLGIDYPVAYRGKGYAHHELANEFINKGLQSPVVRDFLRHLKKHDSRRIVVSSESFSTQLKKIPGLWRACGKRLPTQLIIVVRRMDRFMESMYLQSTRFGHYNDGIDMFIRTREKWRRQFLENLGWLKAQCGDSLHIVPLVDNFDVLTYFEVLLDLKQGDLTAERSRLPSTAKYSAKSQSLLLDLDRIRDEMGVQLDRAAIIKAIPRGRIQFANDIMRYSVLSCDNARAIQAEALATAQKAGVLEYVEAFGDIKEIAEPYVELGRALLNDQDLRVIHNLIPG